MLDKIMCPEIPTRQAFLSRTSPLDYNFDAGAAFPTVVISLYSNLRVDCQYENWSPSPKPKVDGGNRQIELGTEKGQMGHNLRGQEISVVLARDLP